MPLTPIREAALAAPLTRATPAVPTDPALDTSALLADDDDPLFVTLKVAEVGAVSRPPNRLLYDAALVNAIAAQGVGADALMGHLPDNARDSAYPIDDRSETPLAGVWVGFRRVGETLWGKVYIPARNQRVRAYLRQLRAVGGALRTSIYGTGRYVPAEDGARRVEDFTLESIDFAPATRAALELDGAFEITTETAPAPADDEPQPPLTQGDEGLIAELTALRMEVHTLRAAATTRALHDAVHDLTATWAVTTPQDRARVAALGAQVRREAEANLDATTPPEQVRETVRSIWRRDDVQALAAAVRDALAGPPPVINGRNAPDDDALRQAGRRFVDGV